MAENILYISKNRVATLSLFAVQSDNLTPLKVVFENHEEMDPTSLFRIDFERSDGSKAYLGAFPIQEVSNITIPDAAFSKEGKLSVQAVVTDDTGLCWHSSIADARLPRAIEADIAATPDDRRFVEIPYSFVQGNLVSYNETSGRLIDLNISYADLLQLYTDLEDWLANTGGISIGIDDNNIRNSSTWSSQKIDDELASLDWNRTTVGATGMPTPNLNLPQWIAGDQIERADFNAAFLALDGDPERGSNANGHWARWANGLQMCWYETASNYTTTGTAGNINSTPSEALTFPKAFASVPIVAPACRATNTYGWGQCTTVSTTGVTVRGLSINTVQTVRLGYVAIGFWK